MKFKFPDPEIALVFLALACVSLAAGGWIANIVKLAGMLDGSVTAMFIARIVGIFAAPLGVVLGFV